MFDWIPIAKYTAVHYHVLLCIALLITYHAQHFDIKDQRSIRLFDRFGYIITAIYILYMGSRGISGTYFGDTYNYAQVYYQLQEGRDVIIEKDFMFNYFMKWCSGFMDVHTFYLIIDVFYVIPCVFFARKYFGQYWFFAMFMFLASFSFWSYGVNGLRNGLGTAFFIMGLYFYDRKYWMYAFFALGYFMHASMIIPIAAFIATSLYKNPKWYLYIWLASIPLSLAGGSAWASFFASLGFAEDRTQGYLTGGEQFEEQFSQTGFRWDFLLYSASAVFAGWYYIFKKKITDKFYIHLFGTYCIANAFWILVITAAFSNRFAYLSWFLMAPVIAYPMFRFKIWKDQYKISAYILFAYFMFTYFMNVIKG